MNMDPRDETLDLYLQTLADISVCMYVRTIKQKAKHVRWSFTILMCIQLMEKFVLIKLSNHKNQTKNKNITYYTIININIEFLLFFLFFVNYTCFIEYL